MFNEYRLALKERNEFDVNSTEWKQAQKKVEDIVEMGLRKGSREIAFELVDEVYQLNDCGADLSDEMVQKNIALLRKHGFESMAQELEELDWE